MEQKIEIIRAWLQTGSINIFGAPFSGKDTQGERLASALGAVLIAGGDILRSRQDHPEVQRVMAEGGIIQSSLYEEIVLPHLSQESLRDKPLVLSSVGRGHGEEPIVMRTTANSGHPLKAVIYLTLSDSEVWKRFEAREQTGERGIRQDDSRKSIEKRLLKFTERTLPVIDYYRKKGLLIQIDGSGSRDEVERAIITQLVEFAQAS